MGRAERRKMERKNRIEERKGRMSRSELKKIEAVARDEVSKYNVEALMTCFALAEHRLYKFGRKRCLRSLQYIDELMGAINNDEATIEDYKKELESEIELTIKCD